MQENAGTLRADAPVVQAGANALSGPWATPDMFAVAPEAKFTIHDCRGKVVGFATEKTLEQVLQSLNASERLDAGEPLDGGK